MPSSAEPKQLAILRVDDAFFDQKIEIDGAAPKRFADQDHRDWLDLSRLNQRQNLEQFVECAVSPGKRDQRFRAQQQMQLAQSEIVKAEAQIGGDIGVRKLLVRQFDIQPDRLGADIEGAAVRGLHQAGTAAGHDYQARRLRAAMRPADQAPEFPRDVIIMALGENPFGGRRDED